MLVAIGTCFSAPGQNRPNPQTGQSAGGTPDFTENDATDILDNLQAALQSYNRKKFLAAFDPQRMTNFPAFRNGINGLFDRYDSFTVTYQLMQAAMERSNGIVLADFGLDGTSDNDATPDLRRHAQLRLVLFWDGKQWKIVDLSPRAMFQ